MKQQTTKMGILTHVSIATMFVAILAATAMAATDGSSTGSFDLGSAAPTVTGVELYDAEHNATVADLTPTTEFAVKITAGDVNTIADIDAITVVIKAQGYAGTTTDVSYNATYQWTNNSGWALIGPTDTQWTYESGVVPSDMTAMSDDWYVNFKLSEAATSEANWDLTVTADDGEGTGTATKLGIPMNFYAEISAADTSYSFGGVALGALELPIIGDDQDVDVNVTANGDFKLYSKSDATWVGNTTGDIATVNPEALNSSDIQLRNGKNATFADGGCVQVEGGLGYYLINDFSDEVGPTAEAGENRGIYQWLSVASTGLLPDEYQGTYYVQILNV
ncbi:MAG: hypothetical protein EF813_10410 [Methanosarcinales archaeon]|nr:MAG: hypothetical protein EF813_10410 [Methanosarcinales archaeon]